MAFQVQRAKRPIRFAAFGNVEVLLNLLLEIFVATGLNEDCYPIKQIAYMVDYILLLIAEVAIPLENVRMSLVNFVILMNKILRNMRLLRYATPARRKQMKKFHNSYKRLLHHPLWRDLPDRQAQAKHGTEAYFLLSRVESVYVFDAILKGSEPYNYKVELLTDFTLIDQWLDSFFGTCPICDSERAQYVVFACCAYSVCCKCIYGVFTRK